MYCQNCGIENESNAEYCKSCGQPLNVTQDVQPSKNKKKIPKALIWIPLATVFLVAIGVFGYRHFTGGRQTYEPCTVIAYDEDGDISWKETWNKYGETEEAYSYYGDGEKIHFEYKNEYDSKGRRIREEWWYNDQFDGYGVYEYIGNMMTGKVYDEDGDMTGTIEATLNNKGLATTIERYNREGKKFETSTYEYDDHGYITKIVSKDYDDDGDCYHKTTVVREYIYKHRHPVTATNTVTESRDDEEDVIINHTWEFIF